MKKEFKITGFYYEKKGYKFRKFLHIKKNDSKKEIPDLMVIMMNPGSSRPIDGIENNTIESPAVPDNTQYQIMRVMLNCNLEFARIFNLSDLREPKSGIFYSKISEMEKRGIAHSIFDLKRNNEFDKLFISDVPIINAWGVSEKLQDLAENTIKRLGKKEFIGLRKESVPHAYYHPLPQNAHKQKEWVKVITEMIKKRKN
ncbi:hypothetical protein KAJ27_21795 [bacterium]|nr:hypothetical protein [bacterium]